MSRQSRVQNQKRMMGRFEIESGSREVGGSDEQRERYDTSLRGTNVGTTGLSSLNNATTQHYRSTDDQGGIEEERRVEVTHHPRLDYEQRAKRKCYLTIFLTVCLVGVAIIFVANLSSGLASSLNDKKQRQENAFANGGSIDEGTIDVDGADISVSEIQGSNMDVAFQTPSLEPLEEEEEEEEYVDSEEESAGEDGMDLSNYNCIDDRLSNRIPLKHGTFLCSHRNGYVVGIVNGDAINDSAAGDLIWRHVPSGETHSFHRWREGTDESNTNGALSDDMLEEFILSTEGVFQLYNAEGLLLWESQPHPEKKNLPAISYSDQCLDEYACPYLHLHSDGVIVLNWVAENGWNEKNIMKLYDFPEY